MRGFYVVKNPLIKPSLSINERFSTIEGSTIEGFRCTWHVCQTSNTKDPDQIREYFHTSFLSHC